MGKEYMGLTSVNSCPGTLFPIERQMLLSIKSELRLVL